MFNQLVKETIKPCLHTASFKKKALLWNRQREDFIDVIYIQKFRFAPKGTVDFTMNIGVFVPNFYEVIWGKKPTDFVKEVDCTVRRRIGRLMPNPSGKTFDKWWEIDSQETLEKAKAEIKDALEQKVLPFLDHLRTTQDIHDFMVSLGKYELVYPLFGLYLAMAKYSIGDIEGCKKLLMENKWEERAARVRATLNLPE